MKNKIYDVIVVGAGPIGCYTAYLLAKEGLNVKIFEKNASIGKDINCTGIVSTECLRYFDLPRNVVIRPIESIKAFSPSGNYIRYQSPVPLAYVINRSLFDTEINTMAVKKGASTHLNTQVENILTDSESFKVKVKTDGEEQEFRSRVGIIATGFELNSFKKTIKRPKNFFYGIQTDAKMEKVTDVEVYFGEKIAPGSFGWVVPTHEKSAKIGLLTKEDPVNFLKNFLQNSLIMSRLTGYDSQIKCSLIPFGSIPKSYAERFIVVGEAAGQVKTTTGGGIFFGLLCSEIAVKTIMKAFKSGDYSEKVFKEYEIAWKSKLGNELKSGIMIRNLFSKLKDNQIDYLVDLAKRDGILPSIKKSNFDWHKDIIISISRHLISKKFFNKS
jgi:digeranylgeranylglycerophospholipid reductase